jgi:hypothetical protein
MENTTSLMDKYKTILIDHNVNPNQITEATYNTEEAQNLDLSHIPVYTPVKKTEAQIENLHTLSLKQVTEQYVKFVSTLVNDCENGIADYLETFVDVKEAKSQTEKAYELLNKKAVETAKRYHKDELKERFDLQLIKRATTTYNFTENEQWQEITNQIKNLDKKRKELEEIIIQSAKSGFLVADENGVEVKKVSFEFKETEYLQKATK